MRAVSIRQPGAAAVFARSGPFHLPCWRTDYRGPLLIHAAPRGPGDAAAGPSGGPVYGALLGVVELADCVETAAAGGDPDEGGWAWVLCHARAFARPVPHPGRSIGLFEVADAVVADALAGAAPPGRAGAGKEGR